MKSRHQESQNPQHRRLGLLLAGAALGVAIGLAVVAAMLPRSDALIAAHASAAGAAVTAANRPAPSAAPPALEYPGAMGTYSDRPAVQPPTF